MRERCRRCGSTKLAWPTWTPWTKYASSARLVRHCLACDHVQNANEPEFVRAVYPKRTQ